MSWTKDADGQSSYMETVGECIFKIDRWEHGYYVAVYEASVYNTEEEISIPLKYFYTFQDARIFFTQLIRLLA